MQMHLLKGVMHCFNNAFKSVSRHQQCRTRPRRTHASYVIEFTLKAAIEVFFVCHSLGVYGYLGAVLKAQLYPRKMKDWPQVDHKQDNCASEPKVCRQCFLYGHVPIERISPKNQLVSLIEGCRSAVKLNRESHM